MKNELRAIWLKTTKVVGNDSDKEPIYEKGVVKLIEGVNFKKYLSVLPNMDLSRKYPPKVVNVVGKETGTEYPKEIEAYQIMVDLSIKPSLPVEVDLKEENKQLKKEIEEIKAAILSMQPKDNTRELVVKKAKELGLEFAKNAKTDKLVGMIQEIEPDFSLNLEGE